ncbi:sulfotransferase family 2 domain-containing protein [Sphingomonas sp. R86521]|uniref:sulfotransferase family 2 domain-containing protein n=1 Tax=Sphingomonas sp. R86521 TaxID=3093860 RepID=UPI0036D39DB7
MPIDRTRSVLFIHIPKTAGTSIEQALGIWGDWRIEDRIKLFGKISSHDLLAAGFGSHFLQHLTLSEVRTHFEQRSSLFTFSIVRNPWDRLLSLYHRIDPHLASYALEGGVDLASLSFDCFVPEVLRLKHAHTSSQTAYLRVDGTIAIDFIGRYETLAADIEQIGRKLGTRLDLPLVNLGRRREHGDYRAFYSAETCSHVARFYEEDCDAFGYRF